MAETGKISGEVIHHDALLQPIPDLAKLRKLKEGYKDYLIEKNHSLYDQGLVNIADYDLAGQAYYSRPNPATGEPIPEVPKSVFLREGLAEKLATINKALDNPTFSKFFGGPVELYVEDGFRPYELQKELHDKIFPHLIWQQNPDMTDEQREARLNALIAEPSDDAEHPSPHLTGGAVDVMLRYRQETFDYVAGSEVYIGHIDGDTSERVLPDYFEINEPKNGHEKFARQNRRAFYAVMIGAALGQPTDLQVNPTEWWHWSFGDQMWAKLMYKPSAFYSIPKA